MSYAIGYVLGLLTAPAVLVVGCAVERRTARAIRRVLRSWRGPRIGYRRRGWTASRGGW